jgi:hypothetical protein
MAETSHLNGAMMVPRRSTDIPNRQLLQSYGEKCRLSRARVVGGRPADQETIQPVSGRARAALMALIF